MQKINGNAIYQPSGKAGEYARWACNFYVGCTGLCAYCYLGKGVLKGTMGGDKPTLKKCFKDENDAIWQFAKEVDRNLPELQKHGLFFSFTTDPMQPETIGLTMKAVKYCHQNKIPVKILTKRTWYSSCVFDGLDKNLIAIGFTLTGHDGLEPGTSWNGNRINFMKELHNDGCKTFASIEPIIDFSLSFRMIKESLGHCDLYKIGLMSGQKVSTEFRHKLNLFVGEVDDLASQYGAKIYWKKSITKITGAIGGENSVPADYNLFNPQQDES